MKALRILIALTATAFLCACGGGGGGDNSSNINLEGTWQGLTTLTYSYAPSYPVQSELALTIQQNGSALSGAYATGECTGTINGSVSGDEMSVNYYSTLCKDSGHVTGAYSSGGQINISGTGSSEYSGNYSFYGILTKQ